MDPETPPVRKADTRDLTDALREFRERLEAGDEEDTKARIRIVKKTVYRVCAIDLSALEDDEQEEEEEECEEEEA
jgi:hypothetical protein